MRTHPPMVPKCPKWSTILVQTVQNGPHFWTYFDSHKLEQNKIRSKCLSMNVFQSYFSKFSQGTCSQHAVNTQKRPLSKKKHAKRSTFSQNTNKKSHFLPEGTRKSPLSLGKAPPQIQTWLRACIWKCLNFVISPFPCKKCSSYSTAFTIKSKVTNSATARPA